MESVYNPFTKGRRLGATRGEVAAGRVGAARRGPMGVERPHRGRRPLSISADSGS